MWNKKILGCIAVMFAVATMVTAAINPEMELARNGKATVEILLPKQPTPQEKAAAAELQKWLNKITGAEFRIIDNPGRQPVISVGNTDAMQQQCPQESKSDLGREGYGICPRNGNLYLYGGTQRGPLYAVMSLLEDDLGCRWYTPDCTVIPHCPDLKFTPQARQEQPQFDNREAFFHTAINPEWALHNRSNPRWFKLPKEWGGSTNAPENRWNVHTMYLLLPNSEMKIHPEFFPMYAGKRMPLNASSNQPCLTSPGIANYLAVKANAVLDRSPEAKIISISQNDANGWCECPNCMEQLKHGYNRTDQLINLVNQVAAKIWEKHPDVVVSTLAYMETFAAPNKCKPDPRLRIQLCTDRHAFRWPHLAVNQTNIFYPALQAWHKVGNPIDIWDYNVDFFDYLKPIANIRTTSENLLIYRANGVRGVMLQGSYSSPGGADAVLKSWVWTKLLWNPNLNWRKLQQDFIKGYFGAAAPDIQSYYDLMEQTRENWLKQKNRGDDLTWDNEFITEAEKYFASAEKAATHDSAALNRVLVAELPVINLRLQQAANSPHSLPSNEVEKYQKLLAKFEKIARANKINLIAEQGRAKQLETKLQDLKISIFGKKAPVNPNAIAFCEDVNTTLWQNAKVIPDSLAGNGYAVSQQTDNKTWSTQWQRLPWDKFQRGKKYGLWVKMRFVTIPETKGNVFEGGIYSAEAGLAKTLRVFFPAEKIKPGYAWYKIADFIPRPDDVVYLAPCNNPGVKEMFCDRMEIRKE